MEKSVLEKMEEALRRPVPYEGLTIIDHRAGKQHEPGPDPATPAVPNQSNPEQGGDANLLERGK
jgi:hypothetical protein